MIDALALVPVWAWLTIAIFALPTRWVFQAGYVRLRFPDRRELGWSLAKFFVGTIVACFEVSVDVSPVRLGVVLSTVGLFNLGEVVLSGHLIPPFSRCRGAHRVFGPVFLLVYMAGSVTAPLLFGYLQQTARVSEIREWREVGADGQESIYLFDPTFSPIVETGTIVGWMVRDSKSLERSFRVPSGLEGLQLREQYEKERVESTGAMLRIDFSPRRETDASVIAATVVRVPWWRWQS